MSWLFSFFRKSITTTTTVTEVKTFYLSTATEGAKLSTGYVGAMLYEEVTDEHDFGEWSDCGDGNHKRVCANCGAEEIEEHIFDETTHLCECGAYDPEAATVKVTATYGSKKNSGGIGLFGFINWLFGWNTKTTTTYTATVKTEAIGTKVTKVEVSASEDGSWAKSNTFTSNDPIETFYTRVTTSDGKTRLFLVRDGIAYPAN